MCAPLSGATSRNSGKSKGKNQEFKNGLPSLQFISVKGIFRGLDDIIFIQFIPGR